MKPKDFPERTDLIAEDQPEYETVPALIDKKENTIAYCLELTEEEVIELSVTKKIWVRILGSQMQPMYITVKKEGVING